MAHTPMKDPGAYLTSAQVDRLIDRAMMLRDRLIIRLLYRTGIRVSELVNIRVSHILFSERVIVISALKKGGEVYRRVAVDSGTLKMIEEYLATRGERSEFLFPGNDHGHLGRRAVWYMIRRVAQACGIKEIGDPLISKYRGPSPHKLRHSHAIAWINKSPTMDTIRRLQLQLGHQSVATTFGYLSQSSRELHETYDKIFEE